MERCAPAVIMPSCRAPLVVGDRAAGKATARDPGRTTLAGGGGPAGAEGRGRTAWLELLAPTAGGGLARIGPGQVVLGRDSTCADIVVAGDIVSRRHGLIRPGEEGFELVDLDSTNGLHVNGRRVTGPHLLADGDLIGLGCAGPAQLRFRDRHPAGSYRVVTLPARDRWTIGRDPTRDIALASMPTVSGHHATLYRRAGRLLLCDERSRNATWVNGHRVRRAWLEPEDTVVIGSSQMHLRLAGDGSLVVHLQDRSRSVRLECVGLGRGGRGTGGRGQRILRDITLAVEPGEFIGILGPSGAGKTTLLTALNGYAPPDEGTVLLNASPFPRARAMYRHCLGYVPQDDLLFPELTVDQSLDYMARLRLPRDVGREQRRRLVAHVLDLLDLRHVRHQVIGSLSGGQRKRVAIGGELVTGPAILFLDEPGAGLDPVIEARLMAHFRGLADRGTTILATTHLLADLEIFDRIIILARGEMVFFGPPEQAPAFFGSVPGQPAGVAGIFAALLGQADSDRTGAGGQEEIARRFAARFRRSGLWKENVLDRLSPMARHLHRAGPDRTVTAWSRVRQVAARWFRPGVTAAPGGLSALCGRQLRVRFSDRRRLLAALCIPVLLALVTMSLPVRGTEPAAALEERLLARRIQAAGPGFATRLKAILSPAGASDPRSAEEIVRQIRHHNGAGLPVPMSVLLMSVMTALFLGTMTGSLEIAPERMMYRRERMAGMPIPDYLGSKLASGLPLTAGQCLVFVACWLLHPQLRQLPLAMVWLTMVSAAWTSLAMGLAISGLDPARGRFSVLLAIGAVLPQLVLSGGIGPGYYRDMAPLLQRVADLLPARWALAMQFTAVYRDRILAPAAAWVPGFIRDRVGFDYGMEQWYYGLAMLALQAAGWLLFCAWLLKRRDPIP